MMGVIVDQCDPDAVKADSAAHMAAPGDALKTTERAHDGRVSHAQLMGHDHGRERVEQIVLAGQIERDLKPVRAVFFGDCKPGARPFLAQKPGPVVRRVIQPIGHHGPADLGQDAARARIVHAQHREAIKRQLLQKFDEVPAEAGQIAAVGLQVIGVDIGDHGDDRVEMQKRGVAFIRLGHDILPAAKPRVGAGAV